MTVRVLSDQSVSPGFVFWSVFCTLFPGFMVVRNQSVSPCFVNHPALVVLDPPLVHVLVASCSSTQ